MNESKSAPFREIQLVGLLVDILRRLHPEAVIEDDLKVGPALRMDIVCFDRDIIYAVDVRGNPPQTLGRLEELLVKLGQYRVAIGKKYRKPRIELIIAIPSELTSEKLELLHSAGVTLWDRQWILDTASKVDLLPEAETLLGAAALRDARPLINVRRPVRLTFQSQLQSIPQGRAAWSPYQKLCKDIFEHLFCPPLASPIEESSNESKVNRRDFVIPNYANDGFWLFLRTHYRADYIVVDAKNLTGLLTKNHVLQVCNYMTPRGTGLFGIIATRKGSNRTADYTRREQWVLHGKLIIVLHDDDLLQMLNNWDAGDDPTAVIRQKIEDFRLAI